MDILTRLSSAFGHRDNQANIVLAKEIVAANNQKAVKELVDNLSHKNKAIQHDCIKTLYEIGELKPVLTAPYITTFIAMLKSRDNRMQWGGMTALSSIAAEKPAIIYETLPLIMDAAEKGTVVTKDHAMKILTILGSMPEYATDAFALILEQLPFSAENQFPTYAENALPLVTAENKAAFLAILTARVHDIVSVTKRKRVEKLIKKLASAR